MSFDFYTAWPADGNWNNLFVNAGTTQSMYQFNFAILSSDGGFYPDVDTGFMVSADITSESVLAVSDPDNVGITVGFSDIPYPSQQTAVPFTVRAINITCGSTVLFNTTANVQWQWNGYILNLQVDYSSP